jgi:hypothetical protein
MMSWKKSLGTTMVHYCRSSYRPNSFGTFGQAQGSCITTIYDLMLVRGGRGVVSVLLGKVFLVLLGQALTCDVLLERPMVSLCYVVLGFGFLFQALSVKYTFGGTCLLCRLLGQRSTELKRCMS